MIPRFYVNSYTKKSQWDKPTAPAVDPNAEAPAGPPPGHSPAVAEEKPAPAVNESTRPAAAAATAPAETSREGGTESHGEPASGAAASYMNGGAAAQPAQSSQPAQGSPSQTSEERGYGNKPNGLFGKLDKFLNRDKEKGSNGGYSNDGSASYAPSASPAPQPAYYGGPPPPGQYGAGWGAAPPPQPGYGSPAPQAGYYGGPPPQQYGYAPPPQQQAPAKKGMGAMGGAALGIGAGLLGGAALASAFSHSEEDAYEAGMEDAMDRYDSD